MMLNIMYICLWVRKYKLIAQSMKMLTFRGTDMNWFPYDKNVVWFLVGQDFLLTELWFSAVSSLNSLRPSGAYMCQ